MSAGFTVVRLSENKTVIRPSGVVTVVKQSPVTVIRTSGIQGPAGPQGPQGPPGSGGGGSGGAYTWTQMSASNQWTVTHNLGYRPAVTTYDSGGDQVLAYVNHIDDNVLRIELSHAISGVAHMS